MLSVTARVVLKITFQYLKKADQVTKRIAWGTFGFEGPERVVICIFARSPSRFYVCQGPRGRGHVTVFV